MSPPYPFIHVIINPASGKDQPMLNIINDVCKKHEVRWDATVTHKYGDATEQARAAIAAGADLVAGYGGDGTQHEVANAILGSPRQIPMASCRAARATASAARTACRMSWRLRSS